MTTIAHVTNLHGFEMGGTEETEYGGSGGSADATDHRSGLRCWLLSSASATVHVAANGTGQGGGGAALSGPYYMACGAFRVTTAATASRVLLEAYDDAGTPAVMWDVQLNASGGLIFRDATGTTLATSGGSIVPTGRYGFVAVRWEVSSADGSQAWAIRYKDDNSASPDWSASGSNGDFQAGASSIWEYIQWSGNADGNIHVDDVLCAAHDSAAPTMPHNVECFAYQQDLNSNNSDAGMTTNDSVLDVGPWMDAGDAPHNSGNRVSFNPSSGNAADGAVILDEGANANGHDGGPAGGPYTIDGDIVAAKWWAHAYRGGGASSDHRVWLGNDQDGCTAIDIGTWSNGHVDCVATISATDATLGTYVPVSGEYLAHGLGKLAAGAQAAQAHDMCAYIAHVPPLPSLPPIMTRRAYTRRREV